MLGLFRQFLLTPPAHPFPATIVVLLQPVVVAEKVGTPVLQHRSLNTIGVLLRYPAVTPMALMMSAGITALVERPPTEMVFRVIPKNPSALPPTPSR